MACLSVFLSSVGGKERPGREVTGVTEGLLQGELPLHTLYEQFGELKFKYRNREF